MHKSHRQKVLLDVISSDRIPSQAELAERLKRRNIEVTQASISRDLDELGVVKAGGYYRIPNEDSGAMTFGLARLEKSGDALVVAKCESGLASAVAVRIDAARLPEIIGTIAGDDTIFIAVKDPSAQRSVMKKIWELFER